MERWKRPILVAFLLTYATFVPHGLPLNIAVSGDNSPKGANKHIAVQLDGRRRLSGAPGVVDLTSPQVQRSPFITSDISSLPSIEDAEGALTARLETGKVFLATAVKQAELAPSEPNAEALEGMAVLASAVSHGKTEQLIGMDIELSKIAAFQLGSNFVSRMFRVTQYLGSGAANVVVELMEKNSKERLAMRILYCPYQAPMNASRMAAFGREAIALELRMMVQACGSTPLSLAASERGIAVALGTAEIAGIPGSRGQPQRYEVEQPFYAQGWGFSPGRFRIKFKVRKVTEQPVHRRNSCLRDFRHTLEDMSTRAHDVLSLDLRPMILIEELSARKVPSRWQELICRLLELQRSRRISSEEVSREFGDLYFKAPD